MRPLDLRCYAILDPSRTRGGDVATLVRATLAGGATLLQLRDKDRDTRGFVDLARAVRAALAGSGVPLLVNDRIDVAMAARADGVHIGQSDMHAADARRLLGPDALIGLTLYKDADVDALDPGAVDYAGIGPVYPTGSKPSGDVPMGAPGLARMIQRLRRRAPGFLVCGISGVCAANAPAVIAAGADGVSVISEIFLADDVTAATRRLRQAVDGALAIRAAERVEGDLAALPA